MQKKELTREEQEELLAAVRERIEKTHKAFATWPTLNKSRKSA